MRLQREEDEALSFSPFFPPTMPSSSHPLFLPRDRPKCTDFAHHSKECDAPPTAYTSLRFIEDRSELSWPSQSHATAMAWRSCVVALDALINFYAERTSESRNAQWQVRSRSSTLLHSFHLPPLTALGIRGHRRTFAGLEIVGKQETLMHK